MKKPVDVHLTQEGFDNLKKEQEEITLKRPLVLKRMVEAREQGDLSENAGYHAAKEELATIDHRLKVLKILLKYGQLIQTNQSEEVRPGSTVSVEVGGLEMEFTIVGELEADPVKNKISQTSLVGSALIGKKPGEVVNIQVPDGQVSYKIKSIK